MSKSLASKTLLMRVHHLTATETKTFLLTKLLPITGFIIGPILISVGIFIQGFVWKVLLIVLGSIFLFSLYFLRKSNLKTPEKICPVCNGTGSVKIQTTSLSEHSVKSCLSYRNTTKTCGMCEGTGLKNQDDSETQN